MSIAFPGHYESLRFRHTLSVHAGFKAFCLKTYHPTVQAEKDGVRLNEIAALLNHQMRQGDGGQCGTVINLRDITHSR